MEDSKQQCQDYKNLFNLMPDPGGLLDQKGNFLLVTKVFEKLVGKKQKDLVGKNAFKAGFFKKSFETAAFKNMKDLMAGKSLPIHDIEVITKGNKIRSYQTSSSVVDYQGKKAFLFTFRDVTKQRIAEKKLEESENLHRNLVEGASDGILLIQKGIFIFANPKFAKLLGYSVKEVTDVHFNKVIHPSELKMVAERYHSRMQGKKVPKIYKSALIGKHGEKVDVEISADIIKHKGIDTDLVFVRDIRERKIAEKKLEESEKKYRNILNNTTDIVWEVDALGRLIFISGKLEKILGYTTKEVMGKTPYFFIPQKEKIKTKKDFHNYLLKRENISDYETTVLTKKGEERIFLTNGSPVFDNNKKLIGYRGVEKDVTKTRTAEKKLAKNEKRFRDILLSGVGLIWEVDKSGTYTYLSGKVKEILGFEPEELIGKSPFDLLVKRSRKQMEKKFHKAANLKKKIPDFEKVNVTKNGKEVVLLTSGVPILDNKKRLIGYRGVDRDISIQKRVEERFQELFDNMKSGVAIYNVKKEGKEIIFKDLNKAAINIEKIKKEEIIGKHLLKIFPEAKKAGMSEAISRVSVTGKSEFFSLALNKQSKEESWRDNFIYRLKSGEVVVIYDDITDKVRINREIEKKERRFRKIFEASPEAILLLNSEAQVVDLNSRVTDWLGYSVKEVKGKSLMEIPFFTNEGRTLIINKFKARMKNPEKGILPYDLEFINKNGKSYYGRIYAKAIHDNEGKYMQDLVMISDVTNERAEDERRNEKQEQLEKMNKLMVGRELKMIELKNEIKQLKKNKTQK